MTNVTILMLQPTGTDGVEPFGPWWQLADDRLVASGRDDDWPELGADERLIVLAPAANAPVRWHLLLGLTPAQAAAAARLQAAELHLGDAASTHIAAGQPGDDGAVPTAATKRSDMVRWVEQLSKAGLEPEAIVPVAVLVPAPAAGLALHADVAGQCILRVGDLAAEADPAIDTIRIGGLQTATADAGEAERWLAELAKHMPLNLLTGDYAPQSASALTAGIKKWLVFLLAPLLLVSLAIPLVQHWQRARAADAAELSAMAAAKRAGVNGRDAATVEAQLDQMLAARGGGPLALSAPLGGLYKALQANPSVALRRLSYDASGTVGVQLAAPRIEEVNAVLLALQKERYIVTAQPMQGSDGMQMGNVTVRAVP